MRTSWYCALLVCIVCLTSVHAYTADDIFKTLEYNADGTAVFTLYNPLPNNITFSNNLLFNFNKLSGDARLKDIEVEGLCQEQIITNWTKSCQTSKGNTTCTDTAQYGTRQWPCWTHRSSLTPGINRIRMTTDLTMARRADGRYGYEIDWVPRITIASQTISKDEWAWFNTSFNNCIDINITGGTATLTNYPRYIRMPSVAGTDANMEDVRFVNASCYNNGSLMKYEIENVSASGADVWVLFPTYSTGITQISMYYNSTASDGQSRTDVWSPMYKAVYHHHNGTGTELTDSTDAHDGTLSSSANWGMGQTVDGDYRYNSNSATIGDSADFAGTSALTVEFWMNSTKTARQDYVSHFDSGGSYAGWDFATDATGTNPVNWWDGTGWHTWTGLSTSVRDGKRHYIVITYNSATLNLYLDGVAQATKTITRATSESSNNLYIGKDSNTVPVGYVVGMMDEVRIGQTLLSAEWVNHTNATIANNAAFTSVYSTVTRPSIDLDKQVPSYIQRFQDYYLNVTYNYTQGSYPVDFTIYHKTNSTKYDIRGYINGTIDSGYMTENDGEINTSNNITFLLDDNIFPGTYMFQNDVLHDTAHSALELSASTNTLKLRLWNFTDETRVFEVMANYTSATGSLQAYYCNSSYTTGTVTSSTDCSLFYTDISNVFNHTHSAYSRHKVYPINNNGTHVGIVKRTNDSWIVLRRQIGTWNVWYIAQNYTSGTAYTSNNVGITYTEVTGPVKLFDYHAHFLNNYTLHYYGCVNNTIEEVCDEEVDVDFNISDIPPTSPQVYSPTNSTYMPPPSIPINWTESFVSPGKTLLGYNVTLHNETDDAVVVLLQTTGLSYLWNPVGYPAGIYYINVTACDSDGECSVGLSDTFTLIYNTPPAFITQPANYSVLPNIDFTGEWQDVDHHNATISSNCTFLTLTIQEYFTTDTIPCTSNTYTNTYDYANMNHTTGNWHTGDLIRFRGTYENLGAGLTYDIWEWSIDGDVAYEYSCAYNLMYYSYNSSYTGNIILREGNSGFAFFEGHSDAVTVYDYRDYRMTYTRNLSNYGVNYCTLTLDDTYNTTTTPTFWVNVTDTAPYSNYTDYQYNSSSENYTLTLPWTDAEDDDAFIVSNCTASINNVTHEYTLTFTTLTENVTRYCSVCLNDTVLQNCTNISILYVSIPPETPPTYDILGTCPASTTATTIYTLAIMAMMMTLSFFVFMKAPGILLHMILSVSYIYMFFYLYECLYGLPYAMLILCCLHFIKTFDMGGRR